MAAIARQVAVDVAAARDDRDLYLWPGRVCPATPTIAFVPDLLAVFGVEVTL
jgi:hypothetical protein